MKGGGTSVAPIYAGVRTDIEKLLEKFLERPTVRYSHFQAIFKEAKFALISEGRSTENELREFSEKILSIALSYCFPPYSYQAQVGAIYLVYALYFLQPDKYRMKIRITLPMLKNLWSLLETWKQDTHLDACYIMNRLFAEDAFLLCMYPEEHNPMTYRRFDSKDDLDRATQTLRSGKSAMDDLLEDALVEQMTTLHEQYVLMKTQLFHGGEHLPETLGLVSVPLTESITSAVKDCEDKLERRFGKKRRQESTADGASPKKKNVKERRAEVQERRAEIRARAYGSVSTQGRLQKKKQAAASRQED